MPLILDEDLPGFYKAAVKKGDKVLPSSFKDNIEDDIQFRGEYAVKKLQYGNSLEHCITSGDDEESEEVVVPNPLWGQGVNDFFMEMLQGGKKKKVPKTLKRKRFHTRVRFVVRKLVGTVGINIEREDWKKIEGKKHKKKRQQKRDFGPFGFGGFGDFDDDDEEDEEPRYEIPGMKDVRTRAELSTAALEVDEITPDQEHNCLTITFKKPLRLFAQMGKENEHGEVMYNEFERGAQAASSESEGVQQNDVANQLAVAAQSTRKVILFFSGGWEEEDMFDGNGEGEACYDDLKQYVEQLRKHDNENRLKKKAAEELQKQKQAQVEKARAAGHQKFSDLPSNCWARKAVKKFDLDVSDEIGFFESAALDEEWKLYIAERGKAVAALEKEAEDLEGKGSDEDTDEDAWDTGMGQVESTEKRVNFLYALREDFASGLTRAGMAADKATAAAQGLFLKKFYVCEDGGDCPRTVEVLIRIFSAVGKPMAVEIEYQHHDRARMTFVECFAYLNARVLEVDASGATQKAKSTFKIVDDLAGKREEFSLFDMQGEDDGDYKYSLGRAADAQTCVRALLGENSKLKVSNRDAFLIFMRAAGVDTAPCNEMSYMDFSPLEYVDIRFPAEKKAQKKAEDAENPGAHGNIRKRARADADAEDGDP